METFVTLSPRYPVILMISTYHEHPADRAAEGLRAGGGMGGGGGGCWFGVKDQNKNSFRKISPEPAPISVNDGIITFETNIQSERVKVK
jgi:hypothetical protein